MESISLIIGDHQALNAVQVELDNRGDSVVRVESADRSEQLRAVAELTADGKCAITALILGFEPDGNTGSVAAHALRIVRDCEAFLVRDEGRVVLLSGRDYLGWPGRTEASIDLAGIVAMGRSLALELGQRGLTVNTVCPPYELGAVEATDDPWAAPPPPITGPVDAEDVAFAVEFLSHPESRYITGQVLHVSGGLSVLSSLSA
ncbi:SDR family oxidoreductase [Nocardia xishanensis]|uniref:SDR family oxidoreductase n=1 Tax=Nocardia xishanensis TaxID=238964 RepID=UPI000837363F|nr:SDR family oxidoreductase [Nocardia xishanensis]